jgi:anti-sigma B factor antagonist
MDSVEVGEGAPLSIDISGESEEVVVALTGELDISNIRILQARVDEALAGRPVLLIFDLGDLRFLDSSGIGLLLRIASKVQEVRLRRPSEIVRQIVRYMGLSDVLPIEP